MVHFFIIFIIIRDKGDQNSVRAVLNAASAPGTRMVFPVGPFDGCHALGQRLLSLVFNKDCELFLEMASDSDLVTFPPSDSDV